MIDIVGNVVEKIIESDCRIISNALITRVFKIIFHITSRKIAMNPIQKKKFLSNSNIFEKNNIAV